MLKRLDISMTRIKYKSSKDKSLIETNCNILCEGKRIKVFIARLDERVDYWYIDANGKFMELYLKQSVKDYSLVKIKKTIKNTLKKQGVRFFDEVRRKSNGR